MTGGAARLNYGNANTNEVYTAITMGPITAKYSYSLGELFGYLDSKGSGYFDLSANFEFIPSWTVTPHVGRQTVNFTNSKGVSASYNDMSLTVTKDFGKGLTTSLSYHGTNAEGGIYSSSFDGKYLGDRGAVIGINTAISTEGAGIGFAIPIDIARPILEQALAGIPLSRPWIGVRYTALNLRIATENGLSVSAGPWIAPDETTSPIISGSPAEAAGLKSGDIITAVNETEIDEAHPLQDLLVQYSPGATITLTVLRDGSSITITVELGIRPSE